MGPSKACPLTLIASEKIGSQGVLECCYLYLKYYSINTRYRAMYESIVTRQQGQTNAGGGRQRKPGKQRKHWKKTSQLKENRKQQTKHVCLRVPVFISVDLFQFTLFSHRLIVTMYSSNAQWSQDRVKQFRNGGQKRTQETTKWPQGKSHPAKQRSTRRNADTANNMCACVRLRASVCIYFASRVLGTANAVVLRSVLLYCDYQHYCSCYRFICTVNITIELNINAISTTIMQRR